MQLKVVPEGILVGQPAALVAIREDGFNGRYLLESFLNHQP